MTTFRTTLARFCLNALYFLVAVALIVSPFALAGETPPAAIRNQVILGLLFGVFAIWSMATEKRAPARSDAN
jgi:hypothetical protein